jgi:hypothetical protein
MHNHAQGLQMWTVMQLLTGKLCETWKMLYVRFLKSNPVDPAIAALNDAHKQDFAWLRNYFSSERLGGQRRSRQELFSLR